MDHVEGTRHLEDPVRELDLRREAEAKRRLLEETPGGHSASTLVKQSGLRVVLLALKAGASLPSHRASGDLTVQVLRGKILFRVGEAQWLLSPGRLLAVGHALEHDVFSLEDSEVLLTLSWRPAHA